MASPFATRNTLTTSALAGTKLGPGAPLVHAPGHNVPMRFRLHTLVIATAIGPPAIAAIWHYARVLGAIVAIAGVLGAIPGLFALWYWMLCRSQANRKFRGEPNYDPPTYAPLPGT